MLVVTRERKRENGETCQRANISHLNYHPNTNGYLNSYRHNIGLSVRTGVSAIHLNIVALPRIVCIWIKLRETNKANRFYECYAVRVIHSILPIRDATLSWKNDRAREREQSNWLKEHKGVKCFFSFDLPFFFLLFLLCQTLKFICRRRDLQMWT